MYTLWSRITNVTKQEQATKTKIVEMNYDRTIYQADTTQVPQRWLRATDVSGIEGTPNKLKAYEETSHIPRCLRPDHSMHPRLRSL